MRRLSTFQVTVRLPMHCDLTYEILSLSPEPYNPQTKLRKIASEILKSAKYYEDTLPNEGIWKGELLIS